MFLIARENAYAERINRTIKGKYIEHWKPENFKELKKYMKKAVIYYNDKRMHNMIKECIIILEKWHRLNLKIKF